MTATLSRRDALRAAGALIVTVTLPRGEAAAQAARKSVALTDVAAFLEISADNRLTIYYGKVDLGTGIRIAVRQMVADELDFPIDRVALIEGDTDLTPDQGPTWGSLSLQVAGQRIRLAAATAREALLNVAAGRLNAAKDALTVSDARVSAPGGASATWGELVANSLTELKVNDQARVKPPSAWKLVGRSLPRPEVPAKVFGTHDYSVNIRRPGMLHARIAFPPGIGSELTAIDEASVAHIPGLRVVRRNSFVALLAEREWNAVRALRDIRLTWTDWQGLPDQAQLWQHVRATPLARQDAAGKTGDAAAAIAGAPRKLSATYDWTVQSHASLGPSCAVAEMINGRMTVWSPSQATHWLRREIAAVCNMPESAIHIIYAEGSGCYGRNGHEDASAQAALLAQITGRPVRVQWTRQQELGWDPKGPPTLMELQAGLAADGSIAGWSSEWWLPKTTELAPIENLAATFAGIAQKPVLNPGNIHNNAVPSYGFANHEAKLNRLDNTPFRPSWIRSPGRMQNTFAVECFLDECAAAADADAVEYRQRHLKDARGLETLRAAVAKAGWQPRLIGSQRDTGLIMRGRGVAYARYEARTFIAAVTEVEVERATGKIRVVRCVVGHDCGQVINPDGLVNQIEGQVMQAVSRTLLEEVTFDRRNVTSVDWASYKVLAFPDAPRVETALVDRPDQVPWGAGEMATVVVPPAIGNAVFDATGIRLRSVPYTPEKVRRALSGA
jgi:CO/xanthine dehydrogenase Mo-binding subunit